MPSFCNRRPPLVLVLILLISLDQYIHIRQEVVWKYENHVQGVCSFRSQLIVLEASQSQSAKIDMYFCIKKNAMNKVSELLKFD